MKKIIYLDHAATTPLDPRVKKAMDPFLTSEFGNPSAIYALGQKANAAVNNARKTISEILHAQPDTIAFTSGGTESDNLAILGIANSLLKRRVDAQGGRDVFSPYSNKSNDATHPGSRELTTPLSRGECVGHIIASAVEHEAVLRPLEALQKQGWDVTLVPVDKNGKVNVADIARSIRPDTVLVSIMYANNEIGTIEPIADIGRTILRYRKEHNSVYPYFHTDACQAAGYLDLDVEKLHVDLMTLNGGKIYGPKGTGCLYIRRGIKIEPIIYGGSQERGVRGGTENVAGIVGFSKALSLAQSDAGFVLPLARGGGRSKRPEGSSRAHKTRQLAEYFLANLKSKIENLKLNGPELGPTRLPNNLNIQIPGIEGEALVLYLSEHGIMCSTGSACTNVTSEPSHVLKAIGLSNEQITSSLRFTLGKDTTKAEVDYTIQTLLKILPLVRH